MADRICVQCRHFILEMGEPDSSDVTPGADAEISCDKRHWKMTNGQSVVLFRLNIASAATCSDFKEPDTEEG